MFYQMGNQFNLLEYCWNTNSCSVALERTSLWNFADSSSQEWISDGCTCLIAVFKCCIVTSEASRHSWLERKLSINEQIQKTKPSNHEMNSRNLNSCNSCLPADQWYISPSEAFCETSQLRYADVRTTWNFA